MKTSQRGQQKVPVACWGIWRELMTFSPSPPAPSEFCVIIKLKMQANFFKNRDHVSKSLRSRWKKKKLRPCRRINWIRSSAEPSLEGGWGVLSPLVVRKDKWKAPWHSVPKGSKWTGNSDFFQNQTEWLELVFGSCPFQNLALLSCFGTSKVSILVPKLGCLRQNFSFNFTVMILLSKFLEKTNKVRA